MPTQLEALEAISFRPFYTAADIWRDDVVHVDGIHSEAFEEVRRTFRMMKSGHPFSNIVIEGRPGIGKSHFLGRIRRGVTKGENVFILVQLSTTREFWHSLAIAYSDALFRETPGGRLQVEVVLDALADVLGLSAQEKRDIVKGKVTTDLLKRVHQCLRERIGRNPANRPIIVTGLALVLLNSTNPSHQDAANSIILGLEADTEQETGGSLGDIQIPPREVVKGFDRIFGLAGKYTLLAIDQLDGLIALSRSSNQSEVQSILDEVANGLMEAAEDNPEHTLIVISCLPSTWRLIRETSLQPAADRFSQVQQLRLIPSPEVGQTLIAAFLNRAYQRIGFTPPHPTWPVRTSAFKDAPEYSPRRLIQLTAQHIQACRQRGEVVELTEFAAAQADQPDKEIQPKQSSTLDARFEQLRAEAEISDVLSRDHVERLLPLLLNAGLEAWIKEQDNPGRFSLDALPGRNPPLHARLRQILDADKEDEIHWSFRAVPHDHPTAALTRLRSAVTASGLGHRRHLFVIRNQDWSRGQATQETVNAFIRNGGETVALSDDELRTFSALKTLLAEKPEGLDGWLRAAKPASRTEFLSRIQPENILAQDDSSIAHNSPASAPETSAATGAPPASPVPAEKPVAEDEIPIGSSAETGKTIAVRLEDLRRHVAIFAGSGSGKTVLIRRLIEECALKGVSSIVLDPNNDLARLGTPWPEDPSGWRPGDAEKARTFFNTVDVAIWTPRLSAGRPLAFAPLADLAAFSADPDEFDIAIDNVVATLLPRAGLPATGGKRDQGQAVLKQALQAFVKAGGAGLATFLKYLRALPEGTIELSNAQKLAGDMADTLYAATINDPLFGGEGQAVDPATLLSAPDGKRARVSVISLAGLPNDDQRQSFVNQLQMALFAWVKKHPAGDRPLGGLFVMDEAQTFAPSSGATPSTRSTLALASQARKYGLGLVFATQAPKGLHNHIPGNATTQFFGFLNAPVQITAAKEMAAAKGGDPNGIAQLTKGEFFAASDGLAFQKIQTPLCLTYHPASPLTQEEIVALAGGKVSAVG
jgi:hypothetical protein